MLESLCFRLPNRLFKKNLRICALATPNTISLLEGVRLRANDTTLALAPTSFWQKFSETVRWAASLKAVLEGVKDVQTAKSGGFAARLIGSSKDILPDNFIAAATIVGGTA